MTNTYKATCIDANGCGRPPNVIIYKVYNIQDFTYNDAANMFPYGDERYIQDKLKEYVWVDGEQGMVYLWRHRFKVLHSNDIEYIYNSAMQSL
jgi:hypothetical protein